MFEKVGAPASNPGFVPEVVESLDGDKTHEEKHHREHGNVPLVHEPTLVAQGTLDSVCRLVYAPPPPPGG